ncbi:hypothetical protein NIES1031_00590 [Chroogloeocystis siderophila 5.2 s.c.1]|uniref:DUF2382 domain-containing protein n=3 Tax=Chroogloeocystis TaxID=329162 RepID=A0A1U7I098_9CHRO|nr:hypothetical protein NIES1031_00590 [Chroogloeocystis siderophila 5.2 s.c.1]
MRSHNRIDALLEKLKSKLSNFVVLNNQGKIFATVIDLKLDKNKQINLVLLLKDLQKTHPVLLVSKLVQRIDPINKTVLVNISPEESENLPQCKATGRSTMEFPENNNNPVPPVNTTEYTAMTSSSSETREGAVVVAESTSSSPEGLADEIIRLLGERVIVDRNKRKVGEVIVRKEIETRMVEIPVRREKLIVEQVSPERKQLAEIELGQQELTGIELREGEVNQLTQSFGTKIGSVNGLTVSGEFDSPKIASLLLNAIALERRQGCKKVRIEIVVEDAERQKTYQEWFERASGKPKVEAS